MDAIVELWIGLAQALSLSPTGLALWITAGGSTYAGIYSVVRWVRRRWADPLTGSGLAGFLGLRAPENRTFRGPVTRVFDGDTIEVGGERVVRIIGIDAPETSDSEKLFRDARRTGIDPVEIKKQGQRAKEWLESVIGGETVELELDENTDREDPYGRLLAHVWSVDDRGRRGYLISEMIIWRGHAIVRGRGHNYYHRLEDAAQQAVREGVGGGIGVSAPGRNGPVQKQPHPNPPH
jgi:endonuclease YncB( thermonuclease family)